MDLLLLLLLVLLTTLPERVWPQIFATQKMVTFVCDACQESMNKARAKLHSCASSMTCVDCHQTFTRNSFVAHTSCISEAEKYMGDLHRAKPVNKKQVAFTQAVESLAADSNSNAAQRKALQQVLQSTEPSKLPMNKKRFVNFCKSCKPHIFGGAGKDNHHDLASLLFDAISSRVPPPSHTSKPPPLPADPIALPTLDLSALQAAAQSQPTLGHLSRHFQRPKSQMKRMIKQHGEQLDLFRDGKKKRLRAII
jgi:hypothetical protein